MTFCAADCGVIHNNGLFEQCARCKAQSGEARELHAGTGRNRDAYQYPAVQLCRRDCVSIVRRGLSAESAVCRRIHSLTPQEEQLLNSLVERVNQTQLQEKDPDAEALLGQTLGRNPDALYILAQTVLVQNIALEQAKAQVTQLQQQAQQPRQPAHTTSFLGRLLGERDEAPRQSYPAPQSYPVQQGYGPQPPMQAPAAMTGYQPVNPQYAQAPPYGPGYGDPQYMPMAGGPPSFLRGAMQTAAGVAAGALAFEGVESILHGFGHPGMGFGGPGYGMGGGMMGGGFERPVEETVVNNYYDSPGGGYERGGEEHLRDSGDSNLSNAGWENDPGAGPDDGYDASSNDSGSSYDSGSYDSGGGDSGGGNFGDDGSI